MAIAGHSAGRTDLARVLFGLTPADAGLVIVQGRPVTIRRPADAVAAGLAAAQLRDTLLRDGPTDSGPAKQNEIVDTNGDVKMVGDDVMLGVPFTVHRSKIDRFDL